VEENFTQKIDTLFPGGFSLTDYRAEIDAGRPVMIQLSGHSMLGVGYEIGTQTICVHDTWDNDVHSMTWGGSYEGMAHQAVTVVHLASACPPGSHTVALAPGEIEEDINFGNRAEAGPQITSWEIVAEHGGGIGEIRTTIPHGPNDAGVRPPDFWVEPRTCGIMKLVVCFDQPMDTSVTDPSVISIDGVSYDPPPPTWSIAWESDSCMVIEFDSALTDQDVYRITVSTDVASDAGCPLEGDRDVLVGALIGDVNNDGLVDNSDLIDVRIVRGQAVAEDNYRCDVNCDGIIDNSDLIDVRIRRGNVLPP
jgi:hypothetical protein